MLAHAAAALALAGVLVPLLPSTPFALVAVYAAARGSQRLHDRLRGHRILGPALRDWETGRAIATRAKALAIGMMAASGAAVWILAPGVPALAASGCMLVVGTWLVTRPRPIR